MATGRLTWSNLDLLVNGDDRWTRFSSIVHRDKADSRGRSLAAKLKRGHSSATLPGRDPGRHRGQDHRQSSENVNALRKNVTAKMLRRRYYQKKKNYWKRRGQRVHAMKALGSVNNIPRRGLHPVLKTN